VTENKTKATDASVNAYLDAITDPERRADCQAIARLMQTVTGERPCMWGSSIVGFGSYHYTYESGRQGDARANSLRAGLTSTSWRQASWEGKPACPPRRHKMGKACLSIRRLSDVDIGVLEQLVARSVGAIRKRYP
jgi:hypothetical protein